MLIKHCFLIGKILFKQSNGLINFNLFTFFMNCIVGTIIYIKKIKPFIKSDQLGYFLLMLTRFQPDGPAGGPADDLWTP